MPLPKQKHTKSHRNRRRSHLALKLQKIFFCLKCGQPVLPHQACRNCGTYKNREVIDVLKKLTKREQKKRKKELEAREKESQHEHKHEEQEKK